MKQEYSNYCSISLCTTYVNSHVQWRQNMLSHAVKGKRTTILSNKMARVPPHDDVKPGKVCYETFFN